jgi:hypothetical protein
MEQFLHNLPKTIDLNGAITLFDGRDPHYCGLNVSVSKRLLSELALESLLNKASAKLFTKASNQSTPGSPNDLAAAQQSSWSDSSVSVRYLDGARGPSEGIVNREIDSPLRDTKIGIVFNVVADILLPPIKSSGEEAGFDVHPEIKFFFVSPNSLSIDRPKSDYILSISADHEGKLDCAIDKGTYLFKKPTIIYPSLSSVVVDRTPKLPASKFAPKSTPSSLNP